MLYSQREEKETEKEKKKKLKKGRGEKNRERKRKKSGKKGSGPKAVTTTLSLLVQPSSQRCPSGVDASATTRGPTHHWTHFSPTTAAVWNSWTRSSNFFLGT